MMHLQCLFSDEISLTLEVLVSLCWQYKESRRLAQICMVTYQISTLGQIRPNTNQLKTITKQKKKKKYKHTHTQKAVTDSVLEILDG